MSQKFSLYSKNSKNYVRERINIKNVSEPNSGI